MQGMLAKKNWLMIQKVSNVAVQEEHSHAPLTSYAALQWQPAVESASRVTSSQEQEPDQHC